MRTPRQEWETTRELQTLRAASPDDIRAAGWTVAIHNDYRLAGMAHTFWLFTKGDRCAKGEGTSDAEALNEVRARIGLPEIAPPPECPGEHCPFCGHDDCLVCGEPFCEHDVMERHGEKAP